MKQYVQNHYGKKYSVEFNSIIENGKTTVEVLGIDSMYYREHLLKVYYRPERTWDDHMGNTPCGYYCNVPLPNGEKHRVYYR